jgi:hypothetical protein
MSHYSCPICSGSSYVIETRASSSRLRRRRTCGEGHRFTTIELPHETPKKLKGLVDWLAKQGRLDPDMIAYARDELKIIIQGGVSDADAEDEDEPEPSK